MEPHALQLFHFDEEDKLILNEEVFKILTKENVKNKKVCVISIAGAFRQGKSFMQNFFLRYLHLKYKLKKQNITHWLDSEDGPVTGFLWHPGSARDTTGILMWSDIFMAKSSSGEEVAVILLDTQGSFDNATTVKGCATLFALSVLISSVQIYNLKENIKQYDLLHLEYFSGYGQLAADNSEKATFQKLLFLVRDWPFFFEKQYGIAGGQTLLDEVLNTEIQQDPELAALKKNIKESFEEINCCLLPHPGKKVACSNSFHGDINEIDDDFRREVEILASTLLSPQNIIPKKVNGQLIKTKNLVDLIKTYSTYFADGKLPSLPSLFKVTAEIHHKSGMQEAEETYRQLMESCKSRQEAVKIKSDVLEAFRRKKKMGSKTVRKEFEDQLTKNLEELYAKNYFLVIEKYEKDLWSRVINVGSISGAVTGPSTAGIMILGGIASSAPVIEIVVVTTVTGVIAAASGFLIGGTVLFAAERISSTIRSLRSKNLTETLDTSDAEVLAIESCSDRSEIDANCDALHNDNIEKMRAVKLHCKQTAKPAELFGIESYFDQPKTYANCDVLYNDNVEETRAMELCCKQTAKPSELFGKENHSDQPKTHENWPNCDVVHNDNIGEMRPKKLCSKQTAKSENQNIYHHHFFYFSNKRLIVTIIAGIIIAWLIKLSMK